MIVNRWAVFFVKKNPTLCIFLEFWLELMLISAMVKMEKENSMTLTA
jgi:hypothetical protein